MKLNLMHMKTINVKIYWADKNYCCGWSDDAIGTIVCTHKTLEGVKLAYIYNTPIFNKKGVDFDSYEKHLLYILMFSRQYPDSGSVRTMLSDIDKRIEEHLKSFDEKNTSKAEDWDSVDFGEEIKPTNKESVFSELKTYHRSKYIPGGSIRALSAVCTQIALENVGCAHYALRIISRMIDSLKDMGEKRSIIDLVYHKLCNQPNSSYNQLWLQNMTYTDDKKQCTSPYSLRLCQLVAGKGVEPLWNNDWLKAELTTSIPYDSVVDGETLKRLRSGRRGGMRKGFINNLSISLS